MKLDVNKQVDLLLIKKNICLAPYGQNNTTLEQNYLIANKTTKSESLIPETYTLVSSDIIDSLPWVSSLEHDMVEFGEFGGRIEVSREFKSSLDGQPDGYYAIFQYESNYLNNKLLL